MAKNMMDLNLGPDLDEAQELKHEAEMDMIGAHKAIMKFYKSFGKYIDKLGLIKADIPETAFKIEKEDYGNVRDKSKVAQQSQNGCGGQKKPQLHTPQIDQRQVGMVMRGVQETKRSKIL
jgi:hypothetical protein